MYGSGTVFKLARKGSGWLLESLYSFVGGADGSGPDSVPVLGPSGTLYGETGGGGLGYGTVFNVSPSPRGSGSVFAPWLHSVLYAFEGYSRDGAYPQGPLTLDQAGNIYGTTPQGGMSGNGVVFKLSPSGGGWTETVLYNFTGFPDGANPLGGAILDGAGNLYGTTSAGGDLYCIPPYGCGTVFELSPSNSGWMEKTLFTFEGKADGDSPSGGLIFDGSGNLYGTTFGLVSHATVFELMPSGGKWIFKLIHSFSGFAPPILAWDLLRL